MRLSPVLYNTLNPLKNPQLLSRPQLTSSIQPLLSTGWSISEDDRYLRKTFTFQGFSPAWGFLSQIALYSQMKSHHARIYNAKPLLSRNYRGDVPLSAIDDFPMLLQQHKTCGGGPCITYSGVNYLYITYNDIYVLALTKSNPNAVSVLVFLHHLVSALEELFNQVEEESIRDNFSVIYELLDEMMDFGNPQTTDVKILQEYLTQESNEYDVQSASIMTGPISWRPQGIRYKKNELFLDVIESLNVLVSADGSIIRSDINGVVVVNAYLSGMPVLRLGLNDADRKKIAAASTSTSSLNAAKHRKGAKYIELEDVQFHQCVQLDKFENDRSITFIPPDGKFELMHYRISKFDYERPLFLVTTKIDIKSSSRILISVKIKSQFRRRAAASKVQVHIPVPDDTASPRFKAANSHVVYAPEKGAILWTLHDFHGGLEHSMKAEIQLSSIISPERDIPASVSESSGNDFMSRPVTVEFEIPYLAASGLQVRFLKVTEDRLNYQSLPWVRYLTRSGDEYSIRQK